MSKGLPHNNPESLLKEAAETFAVAPAPEAWAGIQQALQKKNKRRRALWLFVLPLALAPLFIFSGNLFGPEKQTPQQVAANEATTGTNSFAPAASNSTAAPVTAAPTVPASTTKAAAPNGSGQPAMNEKQVTGQADAPNVQYVPASIPAGTVIAPREKQVLYTSTNRNRVNILKTKKAATPERRMRSTGSNTPQEIVNEVNEVPPAEVKQTEVEQPATVAVPEPTVTATVPENEPAQAKIEPAQPAAITEPVTDNKTPETVTQKAIAVKRPAQKLRFGLTVNIAVGFRTLNSSNEAGIQSNRITGFINNLNNRNDNALGDLQQQPIGAFGVGVTASKELSRKWLLETGIEYQTQGAQVVVYETNSPVTSSYIQPRNYILNPGVISQNFRYVSNPNYAATSVIGKTGLKNRYHFLKLPLLGMFRGNDAGKQSVFVKAGVAAQYLLNYNNYVYAPGTGNFYQPQTAVFRSLQFSGILQPGFLFRFRNNRELHAGLNLEYNFTPVHTTAIPYREHLFNTGLKLTWLLR